VTHLLDVPELGRRLGQAARERRRREFSLEVMVHRVENLYERLYLRKAVRGEEPVREAVAA
jgi:glycosyltransferase involved in cell wall biosynthesis